MLFTGWDVRIENESELEGGTQTERYFFTTEI